MKLQPAHYALFTLFLVMVYCLGYYLSSQSPATNRMVPFEHQPKTILDFVKKNQLYDAELIVSAVVGKQMYMSFAQTDEKQQTIDTVGAAHLFYIQQVAKGGIYDKDHRLYLFHRDFKKYKHLLPNNNKKTIVYAGFNRHNNGNDPYWNQISCLTGSQTTWLLSWIAVPDSITK